MSKKYLVFEGFSSYPSSSIYFVDVPAEKLLSVLKNIKAKKPDT